MSNLKTYRFVFTAQLGQLILKANISSPTFATWKRSQQSAISQNIDMVNGKADFKHQILKLPVNMYFDLNSQCFQQKKSSFSFTMKTPKGQKTAGIVYIDLSKMLNNKLTQINQEFPLQKCPVKDSTMKIKITSQCLGEKSGDTYSQTSMNLGLTSSLSVISVPKQQETKIQQNSQNKNITVAPSSTTSSIYTHSQSKDNKDKQIKQLKQKVQLLTKQNQSIKRQLQRTKQGVKGENLKQQFLKSKALQDRLQDQINRLRKQNQEHQKQLQEVRHKLEETYTNLYSNLAKHFL